MSKYRNRRVGADGVLAPSPWLGLECTGAQMNVVKPTSADLVASSILRSVGGEGPYRMMPQRRLNTFAEVNSHCVVANDPDRLKRMRSALELGAAIDKHKAAIAAVAEAKKLKREEEMQVVADGAVAKLCAAKKEGRLEPKLTVDQMISIAFIKFHREIKKRAKKFVEAEFKELRGARSDDTWMGVETSPPPPPPAPQPAPLAMAAAAAAAADDGPPPPIFTTDDDVMIMPQSSTAPDGARGAPAKRLKTEHGTLAPPAPGFGGPKGPKSKKWKN